MNWFTHVDVSATWLGCRGGAQIRNFFVITTYSGIISAADGRKLVIFESAFRMNKFLYERICWFIPTKAPRNANNPNRRKNYPELTVRWISLDFFNNLQLQSIPGGWGRRRVFAVWLCLTETRRRLLNLLHSLRIFPRNNCQRGVPFTDIVTHFSNCLVWKIFADLYTSLVQLGGRKLGPCVGILLQLVADFLACR